jgi:hypothetical protein
MRAAASSFALAIVLCFGQPAHAQPAPGGGLNTLAFESGSPTAAPGGVNVAVNQKAAPGFTCTQVVIRVVDNTTGETLASHIVTNPGGSVVKSFTGLGANRVVEVQVSASFATDDAIEAKRISAVVTTR